ncbi:MAG TPA: PfkB family carbohydrate kinase [Planktothrix sp.]
MATIDEGQLVTTLDPKDEQKKPGEKQEGAPDKPEGDHSNLSLGDIMPMSKESLQQMNAPKPGKADDLISFRTDANASNLRGLTADMKRDLTMGLSATGSKQEFRPVQKPDASANAGLGFPMGNRQYFRPVKSEFPTGADDKPLTELRNLTDNFLNQTKAHEEEKLSPAERQELTQSRKQLQESETPSDVLSNALHLARLLQHLRYIDEAKKAIELALGIDANNMLGIQLFKELERMHPVDVGVTSQAMAQAALTKSALRQRIQALSKGKVIVLGDLLIDELLEGKPERISREAPVLILEHVDTVLIPGGAANTAHNIAAMGGSCHAIGVCGNDEYATKLANLLKSCGITHSLVHDSSRPTTVKTRILSKSHSLMQQLLRMDRISHQQISAEVEKELISRLENAAPSFKAVVLSDYKAGVITDGVIEACRGLASHHSLMVIVDAQQRFERFKDATLLTPNQPDTESAVGYPLDTPEALLKAGNEILSATGAQSLLITRGAAGMVLFEAGKGMSELPAFNRSDVFDVTGAGDTVVGTMALALVTGASFLEAMALGNLAAGIVVRKSGTAVTSQTEMLENLELLRLPE